MNIRRFRLRSLTVAAVAATVVPFAVATLATSADAASSTAGTTSATTSAAAVAAAKTFTVPFSGLTTTPVLQGLSQPVAFRFAPGNRIFVATKPGVVQLRLSMHWGSVVICSMV